MRKNSSLTYLSDRDLRIIRVHQMNQGVQASLINRARLRLDA